MNKPEINEFIDQHNDLFWYTPCDKKAEISENLLVETILNYGTLDDIRRLFDLFGIDNTARIFSSSDSRKKMNYFPEIHHYFQLVFKRYA